MSIRRSTATILRSGGGSGIRICGQCGQSEEEECIVGFLRGYWRIEKAKLQVQDKGVNVDAWQVAPASRTLGACRALKSGLGWRLLVRALSLVVRRNEGVYKSWLTG